MKARKKIEWPKVEAEYRAGMLSVREIARTYDVTEGAIRKKAKDSQKRHSGRKGYC